ncbi:MAG TPA: hemolysin family protein [Microbacteriaceae bacterium]|nr:hemolysin family protein [Microbacteriaceae bacterium]
MNFSIFLLLSSGAVLLSLFAAFLSATEAAYEISSRSELEQQIERNTKPGLRLQKITKDLDAHLTAVSFSRVFLERLAVILLAVALMQFFETSWGVILSAAILIGILSFLLVSMGPKSYGQIHSVFIIRVSSSLVRALRIVLGPVAITSNRLTRRSTRNVFNLDERIKSEQLLSIVDRAAEQDLLEEEEQDIIHSVVEFGDTLVREVMVPRTDMVTVSSTASIREVFEELLRSRYSRVPVRAGDSDDIVGVAYLRDLAGYIYRKSEESSGQTVTRIMKAPQFVPDLQRADDLLRQMQHQANHLALVVDEHGGIAGLVTMEDLIEELVGDISDEHDRENPDFTKISENTYIVDARLDIEELGELFDIELDDEEAQTVSGLVAKELGRLPEYDDSVIISGIKLTVAGYEKKRQKVNTYTATMVTDVKEFGIDTGLPPKILGENTND